jgi:hypothetical protein
MRSVVRRVQFLRHDPIQVTIFPVHIHCTRVDSPVIILRCADENSSSSNGDVDPKDIIGVATNHRELGLLLPTSRALIASKDIGSSYIRNPCRVIANGPDNKKLAIQGNGEAEPVLNDPIAGPDLLLFLENGQILDLSYQRSLRRRQSQQENWNNYGKFVAHRVPPNSH